MKKKEFLHPQEVETFYILPTLRRYIAKFLKEKGIKQKDIAVILGVNTATISQYTSSKRGHQLEFTPKIIEIIKEASAKIKDQFTYLKETQILLRQIRNSDDFCLIHKQFSLVPENCNPQEIGCRHGACHECPN